MNHFLWQAETDFGACAGVVCDENELIINTAAILKKFRGSTLSQLRGWKRVTKVTAIGPLDADHPWVTDGYKDRLKP